MTCNHRQHPTNSFSAVNGKFSMKWCTWCGATCKPDGVWVMPTYQNTTEIEVNSQHIEGLPVGTKIVKVKLDQPVKGALIMNCAFVQIVPDNVYGVLDLNSITSENLPDGYEFAENMPYRFAHIQTRADNPIWLTPDFRATSNFSDDPMLGKDDRRLLLRKKKVVRRYLVMDRVPIAQDGCVIPQGAIEFNYANVLVSNGGLFPRVANLRIEEVSE